MRRKIFFIPLVIIFALLLFLAGIYMPGEKKKEIKLENIPIAQEEEIFKDNSGDLTDENAAEEEVSAPVPDLSPSPALSIPEPIPNDSEEEKETAGKSSSAKELEIVKKLVGWGYAKSKDRKIDTIVVHSSYNSLGGDKYSLEKVLDIYESYGVSPHYIIAREGKVYRLVEDENVAYHAGESKTPDGRSGVNNFSIGIEIINSKTESPNPAQYAALKKLIAYLKDEHKIKYTLGHSDIAPGRKDDPWKFDWGKVK